MHRLMKGWLGWIVGALLFLSGTVLDVQAQSAKDILGVPGPVQFEGKQYDLAWSSAPTEDYRKHEYVPAGQAVESFRDMILLEVLAGTGIRDTVMAKIEMLKNHKENKGDPVAHYQVAHNPENGQVILDFLMSDNGGGTSILEWNAYRYIPAKTRDGRDASLLMGISRRHYGEGQGAFLETLAAQRAADIQALSEMPLPPMRGLN